MFTRGIQLGRLFGIRIALDWSLIVIVMLITFNLGAGLFPRWHPEWEPGLMWGVAFCAAVLFLLSILAHELAHALVAKAYAIPVRRITLFLFGGIADIEEEPATPKQEALMAAVGPIASIALGIGFSVLAGILTPIPAELAKDPVLAVQQMGPVATLLAWLGPINIMVGIFNMVPAFPLDGGRVFHAALWAITRDLEKATNWASRLGQAFGWLLILAGIAMAFGIYVPFFGTGLGAGLWLVLIGWFLSNAAAMSSRHQLVKGMLTDVPIARLMRRELPPALDAGQPVSALVDAIMRTGLQDFAVVEDGRPVGIVHSRDIRNVEHRAWDATPIRQIAMPIEKIPTVDATDDAYRVLRRLSQPGAGTFALVAENGNVLGIVRHEDILRWIELQTKDRSAAPGAPVFGR